MQLCHQLHVFLWESMTVNNCNTYFIDGPTRILIDPGHADLFDHVVEGLKEFGVTPKDIDLILCTHAHPDHIEAIKLFQDTATLITIHEIEWRFLKSLAKDNHALLDVELDGVRPSYFIKEGRWTVEGLDFEVLHTPGHSPGSITLYWPVNKVLFTGDLVFKDGFGRVDFPGGDGELLKASIKRIAGIDAEWMLPGHGEIISGADAVRSNFEELESFYFRYI